MISTFTRSKERTLILCLLGFYFVLACFWQHLDFYDESYYLDAGSRIHAFSFIHALSQAPLYSLWFKLLAYLCPDAIWRYFLSWGLLVAGVSIVPWMMRIPSAWLYTLILLAVPFFSIAPYVSLFASLFLVFALCIILRHGLSLPWALCVSCVLCFLVAFARPEFGDGVFLAAAVTVLALVLGRPRGPFKLTAVVMMTAICTVTAMFYILAHSDSTRSGMAFAQHVNIRASEKGLLGDADPMTSSYAQKIFNVDVNHNAANIHATIGDFYHANPALFLGHIVDNLRDYRTITLLLLVLCITVRPWIGKEHASLRPASAFAFVISLPVLAASLVIYPRHHYAVIIIPTLLLLALQMVRPTQRIKWIQPAYISWLLLPLAFAAMLAGNVGRKILRKGPVSTESSNVLVIHCLRNLETAESGSNPVMFDPLGMPNVYLRSPRILVADYDIADWSAFERWAIRIRPSWVVITPSVANLYHVPSVSIDQFLKNDLGYTPHFCQTTNITIYVSQK